MASKFFEHFLYIAHAMNDAGGTGLWDEEDGFFYDVLRLPDGRVQPLKVRSMVGLIPLFAVETVEDADARQAARLPLAARVVPEEPPDLVKSSPSMDEALGGQSAPALDPQSRPAAARARGDARRDRVSLALRHPRAVPLPPQASVRAASDGAERTRPTTSPRNRRRGCSAATRIGAARCGFRSTS